MRWLFCCEKVFSSLVARVTNARTITFVTTSSYACRLSQEVCIAQLYFRELDYRQMSALLLRLYYETGVKPFIDQTQFLPGLPLDIQDLAKRGKVFLKTFSEHACFSNVFQFCRQGNIVSEKQNIFPLHGFPYGKTGKHWRNMRAANVSGNMFLRFVKALLFKGIPDDFRQNK